MKQQRRIAIIGGGFSGISILNHLVNSADYDNSFTIDVYDEETMMGNGHAYQEDSMHLLLNIPTHDMSFDNTEPNFESWLLSNGYTADTYVSRTLFGRYLRDRLHELCTAHENINLKYSTIDDLQYDASERCFTLFSEGTGHLYTHVFLTVGQLGYNDPYQLQGSSSYIFDPYPIEDKLSQCAGMKIGILGSGLSAIDCIRYLIIEKDAREVHAFSRSGEMPSVRGPHSELELRYFTSDALQKMISNDEISLKEVKALFLKELASHNIDWRLFYRRTGNTIQDLTYDLEHSEAVGQLQYVISKVNPIFSDIYQYLSRSDKRRFLDRYHPFIEENHSPMPIPVAEKIIEWANSGKLHIIEGIDSIDTSEFFDISTVDGKGFAMDVLINATGPSGDVLKNDSGIISKILEHFLASPDEFGGVLVDQNNHVISAKTGTVEGMFVLGALTYGSNYLSQSVHLLNSDAKKIAQQFYAERKQKEAQH
ncbi:FAD/NAD(P)-binding protein [Salinicoccus hispanicus]|uniref:SidA/IucD/PvdA family monooxygenase n=1 Tax=Salinicoccus hispanicus TaxID=157225 RepID=A0A6N8TY17_9STAP|nr:FAD/NAD(P)-binding protein [Salinicoccus hispanicus]MXQ50533.1 SidA/IucD/PvdA family monooxygenase [Salinicoccus hispanicus]